MTDVVTGMVLVIQHHKVEIQFVENMLCDFCHDVQYLFIDSTTLCHSTNIVPYRVTVLFHRCVQLKLLFHSS